MTTGSNSNTDYKPSRYRLQEFYYAIRSLATIMGYINSLKRYMNHLQLKEVDDLMLHASAPRLIESQIIDLIRYGISSS